VAGANGASTATRLDPKFFSVLASDHYFRKVGRRACEARAARTKRYGKALSPGGCSRWARRSQSYTGQANHIATFRAWDRAAHSLYGTINSYVQRHAAR